MIDYNSMPDEFQKKYQFDNVRMMANHMIDNDEPVMVCLGKGYYWAVMIGLDSYSCMREGSFEKLTEEYMKITA